MAAYDGGTAPVPEFAAQPLDLLVGEIGLPPVEVAPSVGRAVLVEVGIQHDKLDAPRPEAVVAAAPCLARIAGMLQELLLRCKMAYAVLKLLVLQKGVI